MAAQQVQSRGKAVRLPQPLVTLPEQVPNTGKYAAARKLLQYAFDKPYKWAVTEYKRLADAFNWAAYDKKAKFSGARTQGADAITWQQFCEARQNIETQAQGPKVAAEREAGLISIKRRLIAADPDADPEDVAAAASAEEAPRIRVEEPQEEEVQQPQQKMPKRNLELSPSHALVLPGAAVSIDLAAFASTVSGMSITPDQQLALIHKVLDIQAAQVQSSKDRAIRELDLQIEERKGMTQAAINKKELRIQELLSVRADKQAKRRATEAKEKEKRTRQWDGAEEEEEEEEEEADEEDAEDDPLQARRRALPTFMLHKLMARWYGEGNYNDLSVEHFEQVDKICADAVQKHCGEGRAEDHAEIRCPYGGQGFVKLTCFLERDLKLIRPRVDRFLQDKRAFFGVNGERAK